VKHGGKKKEAYVQIPPLTERQHEQEITQRSGLASPIPETRAKSPTDWMRSTFSLEEENLFYNRQQKQMQYNA